MQYLEVSRDMSLTDLAGIVGERNVDTILNTNGLKRTVNVGQQFYNRQADIQKNIPVDTQQKLNLLNQFVQDSDLFQKAYLGSSLDWKSLAQYNCFSDAIRIPIEVKLPDSLGVLGNNEPILDSIYKKSIDHLKAYGEVDPSIFSEYDASYASSSVGITEVAGNAGSLSEWFAIPFGAVCLKSSIEDEMLYFPVYPNELDDGVSANYEEMGEMLYQYEPWKVYKSSGPREMTFTFEFHRDMWTGDHRDEGANNLVRGCMANCYPEFDGSLINVPIVTLYIEGANYITGVMTNCKVHWSGPIGLDGFYLFCNLSFTIVEISPEPLNYYSERYKRLIG